MEMYPLKSAPVFKSRIWGGQRMREVFGKDLPAGEKIGESWEVADLPEGKSTIANGPFRGQTLGSVVRRHPEAIAGDKGLPEPFPLLIKFIDAQQALSVQVHPDADACRRMGKGDLKTECWYIIHAEPEAVIYKGFRTPVTREQFAQAIRDGTAAEWLAEMPVSPGECHFIPAGVVHALGAGLLIAEVQTPSDTVYRVFDWNRVDDLGRPRPLHIEEALESIHFDVTPEKLPVTTIGRLVDCEYFKVDKGHRSEGGEVLLSRGIMRTLVFLAGGGTILSKRAEPVDFTAGDCIIIPAAFEGAMRFSQDTEYLTVTI
ncbi:MAG: type I phosphomannose isomerase catalytic subunit [Phycisphaerales bacterium]